MYNFVKKSYGDSSVPESFRTYDFGVDFDTLSEKEHSLVHIEWWGWTPEEIQMIIDKSLALSDEEEYDYMVEGSELSISIDKE